MKVILIGDVVGRPGRKALLANLKRLKDQHEAEFVVANVENAAEGFGITPPLAAPNDSRAVTDIWLAAISHLPAIVSNCCGTARENAWSTVLGIFTASEPSGSWITWCVTRFPPHCHRPESFSSVRSGFQPKT